ncbi:Coatomer subunit zeta-2 [Cocos nucifera]|nr:Coatomer subunit zeta-2 [Cocos nucifera]
MDTECRPSIKNILLLDSEGKRVAVKYYTDDWPTLAAKLAFEKSLFTKTQKTNARTEGDDENEHIIAPVLQGFFDAVGLLLRNEVDKRTALENLDVILLCLDEIVDGGIVLETDASLIAGKVATNGLEGAGSLSEQTISQALTTAREHLARSLLK